MVHAVPEADMTKTPVASLFAAQNPLGTRMNGAFRGCANVHIPAKTLLDADSAGVEFRPLWDFQDWRGTAVPALDEPAC